MLYNWIKIIHVLVAVLLFGVGLGSLFYLLFSVHLNDVEDRLKIFRQVGYADWIFTAFAGILQPITGFALIYLKGYEMTPIWWLVTLLGYGLAGLCWFPAIYLRAQCEGLLVRDNRKPYYACFYGRIALSVLALLILSVVFYFMANVALFSLPT